MKKFLVLIAGAALGLSSVAFAAGTTAAPANAPATAAAPAKADTAKKPVKKVVKKQAPAAQKAQAAKKHKKVA
ncbi:acid resistance repetitive basic protein Asr, partial [Dickeya oryzae]|uniref:acid resistance repetitive basic protein Asr n=1 Tax=Dickeya oryzae TaxID=1240404 RepID=UPI001AECD1EC